MQLQRLAVYLTVAVILLIILDDQVFAMSSSEKQSLKLKVIEMFKHAYGAYMDHAYPADELMPLSCKGRYRGSEPSRGDVDDSLGNFTLTLVDTLDTLAIMGDLPEFERAVRKVIKDTKFDADVAVSVFETNIRLLGGLLGGHVIATYLKRRKFAMEWYADELLSMAKELGNRLLPAFNTTTGIPYPRINLKQGINADLNQKNRDTCTACAGTMILEFAALSRLTGDPVYEEKAHKAMDYLWQQRHRSSDLMGTVINIQNGDWIRRESGVGAGIDSYYEYVLKAYILLGDDTYLERFNKHYDAIMKYVSQGPLFVDVHMHRPHTTSRHFMDALLAFWPGLQVLKGDIQPAIELHEMLYQVMQRHNFLPEAFTSDFRVHWGQHPLRPEFVESTYFLYKATGDPHYLDVGKVVIDNLEAHARVPCGFAALKDVTKGTHEDQMDSFVLAETFKYLFLLYADKSDMVLDVDDYIFTTEAHLLPLSLSLCNTTRQAPQKLNREMYSNLKDLDSEFSEKLEDGDHNTCPNPLYKYKQSLNYAQNLRLNLKDYVKSTYPENAGSDLPLCPSQPGSSNRLRAQDFVAGNKQHLLQLKNMGIQLVTMNDGRIQLLHTATEALSPELAEDGLRFMQEMIELSKTPQQTIKLHKHVPNYRLSKFAKFRQFKKLPTHYKPQPARVFTKHVANKHKTSQHVKGELDQHKSHNVRPRFVRVSSRPEVNKPDTGNSVKGEHGGADSDRVKHETSKLDSVEDSAQHEPMLVQLLSPPYLGSVVYKAGPAQFGYDLKQKPAITGLLHVLEPFKGCTEIKNAERISGKIAILERGECMFVDKARNIEKAGAIGGIVIDHNPGTATDTQPLFAMSGDNNDNVHIPMLFLFHKEGQALIDAWEDNNALQVMMTDKVMIFGSEEDNAASITLGSQSESEEKSADTETSQLEQTETGQSETSQSEHASEYERKVKEAEERFTEPYLERMFEFQPLQPVGEGNQFNMKTGTQKVKMHVNINPAQAKPYPPSATDNGIINLITLPDGSKQLVFNLDNIKLETGTIPGIDEIYQQVVDTLQTKTNFEQLKYKTRYISSLLALLEAAYYGVKYENEHVKTLFNEMANELELVQSEDIADEARTETPVQELGQVETDEAELKYSSDQSEKVPHSGEKVQYTHEESARVEIIEAGGMKVKVTSRTVKHGSKSYADKRDFEEGVNQFLKEVESSDKHLPDKIEVEILGLPDKESADSVGVVQEQSSESVESIGTEKSTSSETDSEEHIGDSIEDSEKSTKSKSDVTELPVDETNDSNNKEDSTSQEARTDNTQKTERKQTNRRHGYL